MLPKPMPRKHKKECKLISVSNAALPVDKYGERQFLEEYQKAIDEGYEIVGSPFCMNDTFYALMERIIYKED